METVLQRLKKITEHRIVKIVILFGVFIMTYLFAYTQFINAKIVLGTMIQQKQTTLEEEKKEPIRTKSATENVERLFPAAPEEERKEPIRTKSATENVEAAIASLESKTCPSDDAEALLQEMEIVSQFELQIQQIIDELIEYAKKMEDKGRNPHIEELIEKNTELAQVLLRLVEPVELQIEKIDKRFTPPEAIIDDAASEEALLEAVRCRYISFYQYNSLSRSCVIVSEEHCLGEEFKAIDGYFDLELCKRENGQSTSLSLRQKSEFEKQKNQYILKLLDLQQTFDYFSFQWQNLVDRVKTTINYEELAGVANEINQYRLQEKKESF